MPKGDPTLLPRFLFMTIGSLGLAGISMALLGLFFSHTEAVRNYMVRIGSGLGTVFLALQMLFGYWVYSAQPEIVKEGLINSPVGFYGMIIWGIFSVAALLTSVLTFISRSAAKITASVAGLSGLLMTTGAVLARDAIRDLSLLAKGFDVWNRNVVANWSVVSIFLVLFVAALILIAFLLIAVNRSMKEVKQNA